MVEPTNKTSNPGPSERRLGQKMDQLHERLGTAQDHIAEKVSGVSRAFASMQAAIAGELSTHRESMNSLLSQELNGVKSRNNRLRLLILLTFLLAVANLILLVIVLRHLPRA